MKADAVFEGGGTKGIAFIGALDVMEKHGYSWERVAGTSAGSIVAALISAGYRSKELGEIFKKLNYLGFLQQKGVGKLPWVGPFLSLFFRQGIYSNDKLEQFIDQLLRQKGLATFGDLPKEKLRIIASDITAGKMLVLPDDLPSFGIDPQRFSIARAVRMSSTIPYFFQPVLMEQEGVTHYIVDGGLLSNFPIWLFDVTGVPRWPTFGFRLHDSKVEEQEKQISGLYTYTKALITTMLDAHDRFYVKKAQAVRTIFIPTSGARATNFALTEKQRELLYQSGVLAAQRFLKTWDFQAYNKEFRQNQLKA